MNEPVARTRYGTVGGPASPLLGHRFIIIATAVPPVRLPELITYAQQLLAEKCSILLP